MVTVTPDLVVAWGSASDLASDLGVALPLAQQLM
jgi:hypothetical protein